MRCATGSCGIVGTMADDPAPGGDVEPRIRQQPAEQRYVITLAGRQVGLAAYLDAGEQRIFYHTEIDDEFSGRGLAGRLVGTALTETRAAGKRIVPVCPYVARYVESHHDFDDALDRVTPAALEAAREAMHG